MERNSTHSAQTASRGEGGPFLVDSVKGRLTIPDYLVDDIRWLPPPGSSCRVVLLPSSSGGVAVWPAEVAEKYLSTLVRADASERLLSSLAATSTIHRAPRTCRLVLPRAQRKMGWLPEKGQYAVVVSMENFFMIMTADIAKRLMAPAITTAEESLDSLISAG